MQARTKNISILSRETYFPHPAPKVARQRILPVFTPQAGCRGRCIFCAQDKQTGKPGATLEEALSLMIASLKEEQAARETLGTTPHPLPEPLDVAFYGGSFTAIPIAWQRHFLDALTPFRRAFVVRAARCSTRPDAIHPDHLALLAAMGLDMVELGVQTFDSATLLAAGRAHSPQDVFKACAHIRQAGLKLGLHLLPGLPRHSVALFAQDVTTCLAIMPDTVRLHPCLVLEGSGLETLWRANLFHPWSLEQTVRELAWAVLTLWRGGVGVSRIGLAPEPSLEAAVLAGPRHPALGTMVRGRALFLHIREILNGRTARGLAAPKSVSGEFWGHGRELAQEYAALGLSPEHVRFQDRTDFLLEYV